jgi:hypothetical protein
MSYDPLAQYRPKTAGSVSPNNATTDEYVAFGVKNSVLRLRIRDKKRAAQSPDYKLLTNVVSDFEGTHIILIYTFLIVEIHGKNLQKLVFALESGVADFIQEFNPALWQKPVDASAAIIDAIASTAVGGSSETTH